MKPIDRFAVMGNPVAHSLSPMIHQQFAAQFGHEITYEKILINEAHFSKQVYGFFNQGGKGLNITLPCKTQAYELCEEVTDRAKAAAAANTLWMEKGRIHGDNTDGIGLVRDLERYFDLNNKSILILGAGGAAAGIIAPLWSKNPAKITLANRTIKKAQALQERFPQIQVCSLTELGAGFDLLINATSLSLEDKTISLPESVWSTKPLCYDLSYKCRTDTAFVKLAKENDCQGMDGLGMLVEQAAESYSIWQGVKPDTVSVLASLKERFNHCIRS